MALLTAVVVIAGLHFGAEVVIPFALAVLLSFLLSYPVSWLERLKLGRIFSVVIVLLVAFSAGGAMIWVGTQQLADIVSRLPEYQENIQRKLEAIRNPAGSELAKVAEAVREVTTELSPGTAATAKANRTPVVTRKRGAPPPPQQPVPVQIVKEQPSMLDSLGLIGSSLARVLATAAAVLILTLFMLLKRNDLRNRLFRLFGRGRINLMTTALDDAASRVSRYLLTQSAVNGTYGLLLGLGLWGIGVPYAAFWGVSAAFLRFIPYVGTLIAGGCPVLLSLAVFDGWTKPLLALGVFAAVELTVSAFIEPWIYATRTGISSLAILLSAAFWTMLWGPIGLVLSTPLTVLLLVIGRHVANLEFLYILLGDEPVLAPEAHYYQRLLAMDEDEARDVAEEYLEHHTLPQLYDSVLIPALSLAEHDRHDDQLDEERQRFILQSTRDLIEELGERVFPESEGEPVVENSSRSSILCVPARDDADELVALMLAQVLRRSGQDVQSIANGFLEDMLAGVKQFQPDVLFISAVPPFAITHARSLCRKVQRKYPDMKTIVGLWSATVDQKNIQQRLGPECSKYVVHTIAEAQLQLHLFTGESQSADQDAAAVK